MSVQQVELTGTVRADGGLELDGPVALGPGRVKVVVQLLPPELPKDGPFWLRMQAIWDRQKASGRPPRSAEEIDAELNDLRGEWDERQAEIERIQEEGR